MVLSLWRVLRRGRGHPEEAAAGSPHLLRRVRDGGGLVVFIFLQSRNSFMTTVIFSLGSNVGNREGYLEHARTSLQEFLTDFKASRVIETAPLYVTDQPVFLNQVIMGKASIAPAELVVKTKELQQQIGRTKTYQNGPREIDIDILYYNNLIIDTAELVIPHPRIAERLFVLGPLCELAPDWVCPVTRKSVQMMLDELVASK